MATSVKDGVYVSILTNALAIRAERNTPFYASEISLLQRGFVKGGNSGGVRRCANPSPARE
jgi:hypothetical protein